MFAAQVLSLNVFQTGWARAMAKPVEAGEAVCLTGKALAELKVGSTYEFTGQFKIHSVYGRQFEAQLALNHVPVTPVALQKLLIRCFSGIGVATAKKLIDLHRDKGSLTELRDQLLNNPYEIDFSAVTHRTVAFIAADDIAALVQRKFALHLLGVNRIGSRVINALAKQFTQASQGKPNPIALAWSSFAQNPYAPIRSIDGYGFITADAIADALHVANDNPNRLAAMLTHALDEACTNGGNSYLSRIDLAEALGRLDPRVQLNQALNSALKQSEPIEIESSQGQERYYPRHLYLAECRAAASLASRTRSTRPMLEAPDHEVHRLIRDAERIKNEAFKLDDSQRQAVFDILTSAQSLHSVTAGPGCGKTAIMEILVLVLASQNAKPNSFGFCAPTGKAAKVLNTRIARINATARTIHATLGVTENGFEHNAENLLGFKVLVVDESSMVDLQLLDALLQATPLDTHLILLGDVKQLPSVGPGNCLADILRVKADHKQLNKTHRNQGGILEVVNQAASGIAVLSNRDDVRFIDRLPEATEEHVDGVIDFFARALEQSTAGLPSVCLLMARRRGNIDVPGWNTTYLNRRMRDRFNPEGKSIAGSTLRIGDRIIIRKNILLKEETKFRQIVNGDTGSITSVVNRSESPHQLAHLVVHLDDGTDIRLPAEAMIHLDWAYAMTVHSAQGSEYQRVIFLCVNGSPNFVHRGIVFTAYSRAREHLTVIADPSVLRSVLRRPQPHRNSALVERINAMT